MRLMLFRQTSQPDVPVPRAELNKVILGSYKDSKKSNIGNLAVALCQDSFCNTMGMEMKELVVAPVSKTKLGKLAGVRSITHLPLTSTMYLLFACPH